MEKQSYPDVSAVFLPAFIPVMSNVEKAGAGAAPANVYNYPRQESGNITLEKTLYCYFSLYVAGCCV